MIGRDPAEPGRGATPLELLFDVTFVGAFAQASDQAAEQLGEGHTGSATVGFLFVTVAVCWAWVNFSWFASAFDTDDWFFRLTTMIQMVGVLVVTLGTPPVFASIAAGAPLDIGVLVGGYVVMRIAMVSQWLRVARQDPVHRRVALTFAGLIAVAQLGWVLVALLRPPAAALVPALAVLYLVELGGPVIAERVGTLPPWHAGHLAERYGLFMIITLGEVVLGTTAAVTAVVARSGWSLPAALVVVAGTGLACAMWWIYFIVPVGAVLRRHRRRAWVWGYGGIVAFSATAAMGSGLQTAALVAGGDAEIEIPGAVVAVAVPVVVSLLTYFGIYACLVRAFDPFHWALLAGCVAILASAVALAVAGAGLGVCLLVVMLGPVVVVVGYETIGHRHMTSVLQRVVG